MRDYWFLRSEGFYFLECSNDEDARINAENNPGTLKVVNPLTGNTVWQCTHSADPKDRESSTPTTSSSDSATPAPDVF